MSVVVQLDGSAYSPAAVTLAWSKVSGPGAAGNPAFSNAAIRNPTATFTQSGVYVLRLTASDAQGNTAFDDAQITAVANVAPTISAGPDLTVVRDLTTTLQGLITDDGYPLVGRNLVPTWSKFSGPGTVTFNNSHSATSNVSANTVGSYVLRLSATDGVLSGTPDDMTLTVVAPAKYATATPQAAPSSLTGMEFHVDMSRFDAAWWAVCDAAGASVRVTDQTGLVSLPFDLVSIDTVAKTGFLVFNRDASAVNSAVRVYCGGASPVALPATDTYGQYNAYNSATVAFYPTGRGNDRTRNQLHLTEVGGPTNTAGPLSLTAAVYGTSKYAKRLLPTSPVDLTIPAKGLCSISAVTTAATAGTSHLAGVVRTANQTVNSTNSSMVVAVNNPAPESAMTSLGSAGENMAGACAAFAATWRRHTTSAQLSGDPFCTTVVVNRQAVSFNTAGTAQFAPMDFLVIGAKPRLTPDTFHSRPICLVTLRNTRTSTTGTWKDFNVYQEYMLDQATFWGTWTTV
jgi:hypothetical protein